MERDETFIPPVPVGLEHVLGLAGAHEAYATLLASDRDALLATSGVDLTPRERAMLAAAPAAAIEQMAQAVRERLDEPDRRRFFAQASAALAALGGGALAGCRKTGQDERDEEQERIRQHRLQSQQSRPAPMEPEEVPPATMQPEPAPLAAAPDAGAPTSVAAAPDAAAPPPEKRPRPVRPATGTGSRPQRRFEVATMGHLGREEDLWSR
jgi:hypothetical protein